MRAVQQAVNNVYVRNSAVFLIVFSGYCAQNLAHNISDFKDYAFSFTEFAWVYLLYFFHNRVAYEYIYKQRGIITYLLTISVALVVSEKGWHYLLPMFGEPVQHYSLKQYLGIYWANIVFLYFAFSIYLVFRFAKRLEAQVIFERQQKELELQQLKQQFNPHFLFNALNSIYSYSLKNEKASTDQLILKMSDLLRCILDNSSKDSISLCSEITFIENYMSFEEESLGKRCKVTFVKDICDYNIGIAPFLLYTFVENAFKYGSSRIKPTEIVLHLKTESGKLFFEVKNSKSNSEAVSTSLGLTNAQKRLEFLYQDNYSLDITETDQDFTVTLMLKI